MLDKCARHGIAVPGLSFVSFTFTAFFLTTLGLRVVLDRLPWRGPWIATLVVASLVFYGWSVPWYLGLLLGVATVGWGAGILVARLPARSRAARSVVAIAVCAGLGLLAFFKYATYAADGFTALAVALGFETRLRSPYDLVLPLGISFYTFEMISYVVDVYRGRLVSTRRFDHLLLFVAFFPHLVAGPIVRGGEFLYQIDRRRRLRLRVASEGVYLVIRGLFLKVVVADNLAPLVDYQWLHAAEPGANASLGVLVTVLFAFQILCDFDGYSTIARGAAYLLGFRLPVNFDGPYVAGTFREFWQRWHITLSRWLRDYLYVSLGGNRVGRVRLYVNLLVVMTLGGLWHGAANTFLVWGAVHGAALAIERVLGLERLARGGSRAARMLWWAVVQTTVLVAWVFFRSPNLDVATALLGNVFGGSYHVLGSSIPLGRIAVLLAAPIAGHLRILARDRFGVPDLSPTEKAVWGAAMAYAVCTAYGPSKTFIYFRF
jgi:alginate O-acetyltransferase complex protein AlgI